jgi:curli biogenesis system outer membrane secretion channel CsgG
MGKTKNAIPPLDNETITAYIHALIQPENAMKPLSMRFLLAAIASLTLTCCVSRQVVRMDTTITSYAGSSAVGPKKRVFVAEFENRSAYGQHRLGEAISDVLTTELTKTNQFIIVERAKLDAILKEQALGQSGAIGESSAPKIGELLGANAMLTGAVTQFGVSTQTSDQIITASKTQTATCAVDVRVIDISTGRIIWAGSGEGRASKKYTQVLGSGSAGGYDETLEGYAFRSAIVRIMENLVGELGKMSWSCRIAKVANNKIYLNAGLKSNLALNTDLEFYNLGEAIIDPTSGMELGREESLVGYGRVLAHLGEDAAIAELTEGKYPEIGSIARLKK